MPATMEEIGKFLQDKDTTNEEVAIIQWQFGLCGDFKRALWEAIKRADESNLAKLECGFPLEIRAYRIWTTGKPYSMGESLRSRGLSI